MSNYGLLLRETEVSLLHDEKPVLVTINLLLKSDCDPAWIGDFDGAQGLFSGLSNAAIGIPSWPVRIRRRSQNSITVVGYVPYQPNVEIALCTLTADTPLAVGNEVLCDPVSTGNVLLQQKLAVVQFQKDSN